MSNENRPNKDHWKELVDSLDLDVEFDDAPPEKDGRPETPQPLEAEKSKKQEENHDHSIPSEESAATSKVDPLFDLGWNTPEEEASEEKLPDPILPEDPISEETPATPSRKPKQRSKSRGFGFGLFSGKKEEEPVEEIKEEPAMAEERPEPVEAVEEPLEASRFSQRSESGSSSGFSSGFSEEEKDEKSEGASDWMELAAQLGVPIRSDGELDDSASSPETSAEESDASTVEEDHAWAEEGGEEEYDPLTAWQTPDVPQKPKAEKTSQRQDTFGDFAKAEPEEPIIIGKPKEDSQAPQKERRRGRHRRTRDVEAEAIEITEEETVDVDVDLFEETEDTTEERSPKHRRRRPRRSRKSDTVFEDLPDEDVADSEVFDVDEDQPHKATSKPHRAIPSWEEAINLVIDKNLGNRKGRSAEPRSSRSRGGRGRSGRRGGRSKE